jgi:uncharacterized protein (DUF2384 family)
MKTTSLPATRPRDHSKAGVVLRAFSRIADAWSLGHAARATLLAASPRSVDRWKNDPSSAQLNRDQFERISYILGIYSGLHAILGESVLADDWVRRPNTDFSGRAPIDVMLAGNVGDLFEVRRYVDAWGDWLLEAEM